MTAYKKHKRKWQACECCELWKRRKRVVLARGTVPCDVLFTGEAPGIGEDVIGRPFVGPAGKLLDSIIELSVEEIKREYTYAMTNLVCCVPKDENGRKITEPPNNCIRCCGKRLEEFIGICKPQLIVAVGKLAKKWLTDYETVSIIHPAAILRMDVSQKGLAVQRSVLTIADAFSEFIV